MARRLTTRTRSRITVDRNSQRAIDLALGALAGMAVAAVALAALAIDSPRDPWHPQDVHVSRAPVAPSRTPILP